MTGSSALPANYKPQRFIVKDAGLSALSREWVTFR